ncbi:hypothetical protein [Rhodococcus sp. AD45]|uniref:hypothetical protein n=1 Tax=Rhodococcus sp. (strain AD45) TaxID=103808 RepID=UPI0005D3767C|nr:hypothetical protein [Rhodococcus sp. AD45]KJF19115.1 hypothetical protein SZ00_06042 [Rhodococcus sp. AD45]
MTGLDEAIHTHFAATIGTRGNVIYMSGHDPLFSGRTGLTDALITKIDASKSPGEYLTDFQR